MPDISKVILNGVTQMDVTQDTVAPGNLLLNETATMNNGTRTVGTVDLSTYALKAMLAPVEATATSSTVYNVGDYLVCQNNLRVVTEPIGVNQTIDNSNSQVVLMADELRNAFTALEWSLGAAGYEPTGYATTGWANGDRILCGGPQSGLYEVYDISVGDYIPSGPDVISIEVMHLIDGLHTSKADKLSPTFTGTPTAPTAAAGTNTTQIATTAFVQGELSAHGLDTNGIQISSANDLNDIVTTGWYYWSTTVPANSPTTYGYGSMYVDHAGSNVKQTVFRNDKEYRRVKYGSNVWPEWHEVDTTSLAADLTLHVNAASGNDNNNGLSTETPVKTWSGVWAKIPHDTSGRNVVVYVAAGSYSRLVISTWHSLSITFSPETGVSASDITVAGYEMYSTSTLCYVQIDNFTFTANVLAYGIYGHSMHRFTSCIFDGASLNANGIIYTSTCTFRNNTNDAITIAYGLLIAQQTTIENTVTGTGIKAASSGIASVNTYNLANAATTPYATDYSGRIFVGGRTYKENTGVENLYYSSTPFSITGDKSITLAADMQNYSSIILYLTTSSTNTSGNRCMVRFTPYELPAAPEYVISTNGTNFYGVRIGLVTSNVYTQLRFISTTAPNLYIVQAVGVIR